MEKKEKNTKEKILEEALKLFAQSGYMGTSMNEIASKLGVTKAALYKHYSSKQEILDSIVESGEDAKQLAMDFYGPIFLLYSIYDGTENKQEVVKQVEEHVERFAKRFQKMSI